MPNFFTRTLQRWNVINDDKKPSTPVPPKVEVPKTSLEEEALKAKEEEAKKAQEEAIKQEALKAAEEAKIMKAALNKAALEADNEAHAEILHQEPQYDQVNAEL